MSDADKFRKSEFREIARRIVSDDRALRKRGYKTDTGGKIARALEGAYQRGYGEANNGTPVIELPGNHEYWWTIPSRARIALWSICLGVYGEKPDAIENRPYQIDIAAGKVGRERVVFRRFGSRGELVHEDEWGMQTIRPLIHLGILSLVDDNSLVITEYGLGTWMAALTECQGESSIDLVGTVPPSKWNL